MNTELLKAAKEEAEKRYPYADTVPLSRERQHHFIAGAEWLLSHLQPKLETVWVWVKASDELPKEPGKFNKVVVRYNDRVLNGFRNFSEDNPQMYIEDGRESHLTNDCEWLKPVQTIAQDSEAVGDEQKLFTLKQAINIYGAGYLEGHSDSRKAREEIDYDGMKEIYFKEKFDIDIS